MTVLLSAIVGLVLALAYLEWLRAQGIMLRPIECAAILLEWAIAWWLLFPFALLGELAVRLRRPRPRYARATCVVARVRTMHVVTEHTTVA